MQGNTGFESVEASYHAMSAEAAIKFRAIGEMYAELYPRPATIKLVPPVADKNIELLQEFGELSPAGLCLIDWDTRLIKWRNGAYDRVFLSAIDRRAFEGVRVGDLVPEFAESGLEAIFDAVAKTGTPFIASAFPLSMPIGMTYWDASLSRFPSTDGAMLLFLQIHRAQAPAMNVRMA